MTIVACQVQLRDYQSRAIEAVRHEYRQGRRRIVLCLPTGAGKTVCASAMIRHGLDRGHTALFMVHRRELVRQAVDRLACWGIEAGVVASGERATPSPVQVASIQTLSAWLRRNKPLPPADVVYVDECSHIRARTWEEVLDYYRAKPVIGLSATPYRLDGRGLGEVFDALVNPVGVQELCDAGVLVEPDVYAPEVPDLAGVRVRAGEFEQEALDAEMAKLEGKVVEHWLEYAGPNRTKLPSDGRALKTVGFAVTIRHSRSLTERLNAAGARFEHIDGSASNEERDGALERLASGEIDGVFNCMLLGEGWDLPALQCAVLARPTASMALHRQQVGRIMRSCGDGKAALVLDHAGNHLRLGFVTDHLEVSLEGKVKRPGEAVLKTCPQCFCVVAGGVKQCPECGFVFEVAEHEDPEESERKLRRLDKREFKLVFYRDLIEQANTYNLRLGWARHKFKSRYSCWPNAAAGIGKQAADAEKWYRCSQYEPRASEWRDYCGRCYRSKDQHSMIGAHA